VRCFVVAGFLLTSASRCPSAIAELLVSFSRLQYIKTNQSSLLKITEKKYFTMCFKFSNSTINFQEIR